MTGMVITLLYHDVVEPGQAATSGFSGADADRYKLTVTQFREHLAAIAGTARPVLSSARPVSEGGVLLTFDDGGVSAYTHAADLVESFGWRGHFFVTAGYIGQPGFLTEPQIRELSARGHVIGSHSFTHPARMARCEPAQLRREWRDSVRRLEDVLGSPVTSASVPGGYYSKSVAMEAAAAGIKTLFNSEPVTGAHRVESCEVYGRFNVLRGTPASTVSGLARAEILPRAHQFLLWNGKKVLKGVGGEAWLQFRRQVLAMRERLRTNA